MHVRGSGLRGSLSRRMYALLGTTAALLAIGFGPTVAGASADGTVTLPGSPLIVSVGSLGECQSSYLERRRQLLPAGQERSATAGSSWRFPPTSGQSQRP